MLWILVLLLCFIFNSQAYTAKDIYESLNKEDKGYFYRYYLAKGFLESQPVYSTMYSGISFPHDLPIPTDTVKTFESIKVEPSDFPVNFFNNFRMKYNLTPEETLQVARKRCNCKPPGNYICMPDGTCVDAGDNGGICCT